MRIFSAVALAACVAGTGGLLRADIIFSNFGAPGSLYQTGAGNTLPAGIVTIGATGNHELVYAVKFSIPDGVWQVNQVDAPVRNISGPADAVLIIANDSGGLPGAILWSQQFTNIPAEANTCCQLSTANITSSHPILNSFSATNYWFIVGPGAYNNTDAWQTSPSGGSWAVATQEDNGAWTAGFVQRAGAFDLVGVNLLAPQVSTPEPASVLLFVCGVVLLLLGRFRPDKHIRARS